MIHREDVVVMETKKKTVNCTNKVMATCEYAFNRGGGTYGCDYIGRTGHSRGCPPSRCNKYNAKAGKKPNGPKEDFEGMYIN